LISLRVKGSSSRQTDLSRFTLDSSETNEKIRTVDETTAGILNDKKLSSPINSRGGESQDHRITSVDIETPKNKIEQNFDFPEEGRKVKVNDNISNKIDVEKIINNIKKSEIIDDSKLIIPLHVDRSKYLTNEELYKAIADWWVNIKGRSSKTVESRIGYARAMARHQLYPVDWFKFEPEQILNLLIYKQVYEYPEKAKESGNPNHGVNQLHHDWKTVKMFASAYGIEDPTSWGWTPPAAPEPEVKIVPRPPTVNKLMRHKYTKDRFTTALVRTLLTVGFHCGMRPEEIPILKVKDIKFSEGYIFIHEEKKRYRERQIWLDPPVMYSHQQNSLANWANIWRPRAKNQSSGDFLFIQKSGKPFPNENALRMFLNRHCRKVWPDYTPKIMRDWSAIARLIRTKIETKKWDTRVVKNALGHKLESTTENYIKFAENYYRIDPYDWLSTVLKFHPNSKKMKKAMGRQYGTGQKIPRSNGAVETKVQPKNRQTTKKRLLRSNPSWRCSWARRDLNSWPPGYQPGAPTNLSYGPE